MGGQFATLNSKDSMYKRDTICVGLKLDLV